MSRMTSLLRTLFYLAVTLLASTVSAQTSASALLVLAKSDNTVAIVDPTTLQVLARVAAGPDPHEITASDDGKLAYISNYGGPDSDLHTISVVDLVAESIASDRPGCVALHAWASLCGRQALFHRGNE